MGDRYDVVIVGSGHGGAQTAISLRQKDFTGSIAVIGEELEPPYERPPLSKEYLSGAKSFERILIRPPSFWTERSITLLPGQRVTEVAPGAVRTQAGDSVGYGKLVWAAGGHARRLRCAGHDLAGVHTVRTRADVDRLQAELAGCRRVCVVGGGYIGLEAASVLRKLEKEVVLLEAADRLLARVTGSALSALIEAEHRRQGVDVRLGAAVERLTGADGRINGVVLADGGTIPCDMAIVGIGIEPSVAPLREAGALGTDGVVVDAHCWTSIPDVLAIGDCARHLNIYGNGEPIRLESVQNASDMAAVAADAIIGGDARYEAVPWFWSNQYDLKLQTVGLCSGHDTAVIRGDPAARRFAVVYLRKGVVVALDCVNAVKDFAQGRALVANRVSADPAKLADSGVVLSSLAG